MRLHHTLRFCALALSAIAVLSGLAGTPVQAAVFSNNFLNAEAANDEDGSFGPWTLGGYDVTTATPGVFTAYSNAQHLDNWFSAFSPFYAGGEFKGYGYDSAAGVHPAIVINTTAGTLGPGAIFGISSFGPAEVFVHSANSGIGDVDPARNAQVIRYTAFGDGTLDINALFTQKHGTVIPVNVILNGTPVPLGAGVTTGQDTTFSYSNPSLLVSTGDVLDFVISGRASAAFDATILFTAELVPPPVPEPATGLLAVLAAVGLAWRIRLRRHYATKSCRQVG